MLNRVVVPCPLVYEIEKARILDPAECVQRIDMPVQLRRPATTQILAVTLKRLRFLDQIACLRKIGAAGDMRINGAAE